MFNPKSSPVRSRVNGKATMTKTAEGQSSASEAKNPSFETLAAVEFESLRNEIAANIAETRQLERHALFASAVVWGWLLSHSKEAVWMKFGTYVPALLTFFAAWRSVTVYLSIRAIGKYIAEIEASFNTPAAQGPLRWEHFSKRRGPMIAVSALMFWMILLTVNIFAARLFDGSWLNAVKP
jgi:hypothetical protein